MAGRKKVQRNLEDARAREDLWRRRAQIAVEKGRDDLAREALLEKRRFSKMVNSLESEEADHAVLVEQYQDDIRQLEDKLAAAREKQRIIIQRHLHARRKMRAQEEIRRMDSYEAMAKFDDLENRIDRMEAEADLVNYGRKPTLEDEFDKLTDDDIEKELADLKAARSKKQHPTEV
jgi:phage shock protein A